MNTSFFGAAVRALPASRRSAATRLSLPHNFLSILYHYAVCAVGILQATAAEVVGTFIDRSRLRSLKLADAAEIVLEELPSIKLNDVIRRFCEDKVQILHPGELALVHLDDVVFIG